MVQNKGHRCVMRVRVHHRTGDGNSQWVLKLSDDNYFGLKLYYKDDISLMTFRMVISDLLAFLKFKETFFSKFPELRDSVEFPASRVVIVSFSEYMDLMLSQVEEHNLKPVLKEFRGMDTTLHSGFIFLTMQEFFNLRDLNDTDRRRFKNAIMYLSESFTDVDESGSNLMIDSDTGNLVVLDVEREQLTWDFRKGTAVDEFDGGIDSLDAGIFEEYSDLNYESISERARRSFHRSISIDSAVASDLDSADSSKEPVCRPRGLLQRQFSINEEVEPDEGFGPDVFDD